jgi:hypothetical protein
MHAHDQHLLDATIALRRHSKSTTLTLTLKAKSPVAEDLRQTWRRLQRLSHAHKITALTTVAGTGSRVAADADLATVGAVRDIAVATIAM